MWYLVGFVAAVVIFVAGFFVGGKHKERLMKAAWTLKDTVGEL